MEAYTEFATVYDTFMDNVPYEAWKKYLVDILKAEGINDGIAFGTWLWNRKDDETFSGRRL